MRPKEGRLLSPERHNPQVKTFYEELVLVDSSFSEALRRYLSTHTIPVSESTLGVGIDKLRSCADGKRKLLPRSVYRNAVSTLSDSLKVNLNPDIEPYEVVGIYPVMVIAYDFDRSGIVMADARDILIFELAEVDESIANRLREGKRRSVECTTRDFLTGRKGSIHYRVFKSHERNILDALATDGITITPEQLMEVCKGSIENFEFRLKGLPKPFELVDGYVPYSFDYHKGDKIKHSHYGIGTVMDREPVKDMVVGLPLGEGSYYMTVDFEDKRIGTKKLVVNKRPKSQSNI